MRICGGLPRRRRRGLSGVRVDLSCGNGGGAEVLWERKTYILQPAGFSWQGSENRNLSPTATEYAAAANWKRVFDRKQVPFAAVISGTATP
jgi:hypothetical protein